jgi:hypothetical protein
MTFTVLWIFCQMCSQFWRKPLPPTSACCEDVRTAVGSVKSPYAFRRLHGVTFHKIVTLRTSRFNRVIKYAIFVNISWAIFTEKHTSTDSHLLRVNHSLLARVVHFSRSSQRFVSTKSLLFMNSWDLHLGVSVLGEDILRTEHSCSRNVLRYL